MRQPRARIVMQCAGKSEGFSGANLPYTRRFTLAWPAEDAIRQRPVGELRRADVTRLPWWFVGRVNGVERAEFMPARAHVVASQIRSHWPNGW